MSQTSAGRPREALQEPRRAAAAERRSRTQGEGLHGFLCIINYSGVATSRYLHWTGGSAVRSSGATQGPAGMAAVEGCGCWGRGGAEARVNAVNVGAKRHLQPAEASGSERARECSSSAFVRATQASWSQKPPTTTIVPLTCFVFGVEPPPLMLSPLAVNVSELKIDDAALLLHSKLQVLRSACRLDDAVIVFQSLQNLSSGARKC